MVFSWRKKKTKTKQLTTVRGKIASSFFFSFPPTSDVSFFFFCTFHSLCLPEHILCSFLSGFQSAGPAAGKASADPHSVCNLSWPATGHNIIAHKGALPLPWPENIVTFHFKAQMSAFHHRSLGIRGCGGRRGLVWKGVAGKALSLMSAPGAMF